MIHRYVRILTILYILLFLFGCQSSGPIAPGGNNMAPGWVGQSGIISVVAGESAITVYYGEAIDFQDPPVKYLIFMDQDESPWDKNPVRTEEKSPYVISGLTNGTTYWFGVRASDSAKPPHVDDNVKVLPAMPRSGDATPPAWDDTIGVVSVVPGDSEATIYYGSATDADSPPVKYLVYMDTDDDPWDQTPVYRDSNDPYLINNLINDTIYWFGVRCRDSAAPTNIDGNNVVASDMPRETGWARTWNAHKGNSVAVDSEGNSYVTGLFWKTKDFDPGSGIDNHTSNGDWDAYLSKFDSRGNYLWARTWGGFEEDSGISVAVDPSGNVYVTGYFFDVVDFDPGPGVDDHQSVQDAGTFLSKFDSSGNFLWARTWGNLYSLEGYPDYSVAVDVSGNVYVAGWFDGMVDFDPGDGIDNHDAGSTEDAFLSKFDAKGDFVWARTWGGNHYAWGNSVAVDSTGSAYVTGKFFYVDYYGPVDFDPGPGVDNHTSNGYRDAFLSKFDPSGNFVWARTWGGANDDLGFSVASDSSGNAFVSGWFFDSTVDFDPGPGVDNHTSNGECDIFLSGFDPFGDFLWAQTWGATASDKGHSVAIDASGHMFVTGEYELTVDFDPGPGVDDHKSQGKLDAFLSKFDSAGNFLLATTWGGVWDDDWGTSVAADSRGNAYVTGYYQGPMDFDPGPGVDSHKQRGAFLSKFKPDGYW